MADSKITSLGALSANPADTDLFVIVDVSDTTMAASGTNKKLAASYLATRTGTETFTNKTLTTPTIGDFTNATHTHADAAGGGTIAHSVLTGLTSGNPHTQYLLADGTTTGATSQSQTFTNGTKGPGVTVLADGTTAYRVYKADGSTVVLNVDTTNSRLGIAGATSTHNLEVFQTAHSTGIKVWGYDTQSTQALSFVVNSTGTGAFATTGNMLFSCDGTLLTFKSNNASGAIRWHNQSNANIIYGSQSQTVAIGGGSSPTAYMDVAAATTSNASIRLRLGTAPTSPNDGDLWNEGALTYFSVTGGVGSVLNTLNLRQSSSGTPTAGFGAGIRIGLKSSTTANQDASLIETLWQTATHASRASDVVFSAYNVSTKREFLRGRGGASNAQIGFLGATPVSQQTSGANLTNNVTSGGTDDTIDNWTDLTTYATDAAAIRNAVYQLSRKMKQINDGLRTLGLFT